MTEGDYLLGHVLDVLKGMESDSVEMIITSPPYWRVRDYDIPDVEWPDGWVGQLGLEDTPEQFIGHLCDIFDEARRVLKSTGTCWVNLGDCYAGSGTLDKQRHTAKERVGKIGRPAYASPWMKPKTLCLIPHRFAIEMQERGWILRNAVIWHKPNPLPSSVKDRFANTYEMLFMFSKSGRYFFDLDAVRKPHKTQVKTKGKVKCATLFGEPEDDRDYRSKQFDKRDRHERGAKSASQAERAEAYHPGGANPGDVFSGEEETTGGAEKAARSSGEKSKYDGGHRISSAPLPPNPGQPGSFHPLGGNPGDILQVPTGSYGDAHYATFPPSLLETPIRAGCPEKTCPACQSPWMREKHETQTEDEEEDERPDTGGERGAGLGPLVPTCDCPGNDGSRPGVVLDPFAGSGTTIECARRLGRNGLGIDLGESYKGQWLKMPLSESKCLDDFL